MAAKDPHATEEITPLKEQVSAPEPAVPAETGGASRTGSQRTTSSRKLHAMPRTRAIVPNHAIPFTRNKVWLSKRSQPSQIRAVRSRERIARTKLR